MRIHRIKYADSGFSSVPSVNSVVKYVLLSSQLHALHGEAVFIILSILFIPVRMFYAEFLTSIFQRSDRRNLCLFLRRVV